MGTTQFVQDTVHMLGGLSADVKSGVVHIRGRPFARDSGPGGGLVTVDDV